MACEKVFAEQLKRHGLRMTPQREIILRALHHAPGYASAEEILSRVHEISRAVDVSTVYRTLDLLREFGLVAAVDAVDGQTRYDLLGLSQPHLHLVCQGCGGIYVVPMTDADPLLAGLLAQHGFEASLDDVTIPGLCAACRAAAPAIVGEIDVHATHHHPHHGQEERRNAHSRWISEHRHRGRGLGGRGRRRGLWRPPADPRDGRC